jgi:hypothetical protein
MTLEAVGCPAADDIPTPAGRTPPPAARDPQPASREAHPEAREAQAEEPPAIRMPVDVRSAALTVLAVLATILALQIAQAMIIPIVLGLFSIPSALRAAAARRAAARIPASAWLRSRRFAIRRTASPGPCPGCS